MFWVSLSVLLQLLPMRTHCMYYRAHWRQTFDSLFFTLTKKTNTVCMLARFNVVTWKDVVDLDEIYLRSACKSPASNTAYLSLRSSHCRSTCRPAHMTPNFLFFVWRKLAVILNSAVYHIAMTTCKSTRQDLLLESIQNFVCCSRL